MSERMSEKMSEDVSDRMPEECQKICQIDLSRHCSVVCVVFWFVCCVCVLFVFGSVFGFCLFVSWCFAWFSYRDSAQDDVSVLHQFTFAATAATAFA